MNKTVHMTYSSSLSSLCEINSSFDTGILRIAYHGENRNGSSISKDAFERCIKTMYNCPIVCNYDRETDSIGGHDMELVSDRDGNLRIVNCTTPVGVIPESSKYFWDTVEEDDGVEHEYLCAEALIWKRQEAYHKIREDGIVAHSMEVTVKDGEVVDNVFVIKDFEFTAFCLLGDDHEPCFESSAIGLFSLDSLKCRMEEMMSELKESNTLISPRPEVEDNKCYNLMEGGSKELNEKITLAAEYGIDIESLDFSVEDLTVEELREKFEAIKANAVAPVDEPAAPTEVFALNNQICEEIRCAVEAEMTERSWGKMPRYSVVDFDAEAMMVYCFDADDHWRLYGFKFEMNGDNVVVDFESKKRMKFAIVDFDEGEQALPFDGVFEQVSAEFNNMNTEWSEKFQSASNTIDSMTDELNTLREFRLETERVANEVARNEIFEQFDDLVGIEAFDSLRENCEEMTLEIIEEKCFAIRGRSGVVAKFEKERKPAKLMVDRTDIGDVDEPYGDLFIKYKPTI